MKLPRRNPDGATHQPLPKVARDAPVTVTGLAAEELRRVARTYGGPANEANVARLAAAAVLRGLVHVEGELALTTPQPKRVRAAEADDAAEEP